jgi:U4/U6.U5 tri-snRNP-associated protein 1
MEIKTEPMTSYDELVEVDDGQVLTMDSMSEFCRNLGDLPATRGVQKFEKEDFDNLEAVKNMSKKKMEVDEDEDEEMNYESNSDDEGDEKNSVDESNAQPILDNEPQIDRGLASALALAVNKGYLEEKQFTQNARLKLGKKDDISALNYTVEEKSFYDIDDKYARNNRDRYSGPISDFKEKDGYKPDVKLDYVDDKGHKMNEKEAFRYLSHRFHGKGPGKKKTEKRLNKLKELESMNKMSSVDTPLNTVALLVEKQKKLQQPYVVLSAPKADKNE